MSNRPRSNGHRRPHRLPPPNGRRPVSAYSARELHEMLVADGVARYFGEDPADEQRYLAWMVKACVRIGRLDRCGPEVAFQRVDGEVFARCGLHLRVA